MGRTERDVLALLLGHKLSEDELEEWSNMRVDIAINIATREVGMPDGLLEILNKARQLGIKMVVATSSRRRYLDFVMDRFNIRDYFSGFVTAQDITHGKPHPEIYQKALEIAMADPADSFAIEDSLSGIRSAKSAGVKVVGLASTHSPGSLTEADLVVNSLADIDIRSV